MDLTGLQLTQLTNYTNQIEIEYWEIKFDRVPMKRKIPIPSNQHNLTLMFDKQELHLLKSLLNYEENEGFELLKPVDIDYVLFLN